MKKKKIQNIMILAVAAVIVAGIIAYNYDADQTRQRGLQFGIELEGIQNDIRDMQTGFYSEKTKWEEGDITKEELFRYYDRHVAEFEEVISRYDELSPPELFRSSVALLKLSSQAQLESDIHLIEWIKTGDRSSKIRSDTRIQESLEYEMQGLVEYYSAKTGVRNYDDQMFDAPQAGLVQQVNRVSEAMKANCDSTFRNDSGGFDDDETEIEWFNCMNNADAWRMEHLP